MTTRQRIGLATALPLLATVALAQGPLDPAGAPNPNFKTLQQVEPRIDLATVPGDGSSMHRIDQPGSYYLTDNLDVTTTDGIRIIASGVTLDLMGFTIFRSSQAASTGTAINITGSGLRNIRITNGHITGGILYDSQAAGDQFTGPGFNNGIDEVAAIDPENVRVSHIHVSGMNFNGIDTSSASSTISNTVEHCSVHTCGLFGILSGEVHHCTAIVCGGNAIQARGNVSHSRGQSVGSGRGIDALGNVADSYGDSSQGDGIGSDANVINSYGVSDEGNGILASGNVINCYGRTNGDTGIFSNRSVSNSYGESTGSRDGIFATYNIVNSYGESDGDDGLDSGGNVFNSFGRTTDAGLNSHGIEVTFNVANSRGFTSGAGDGIVAGQVASYSRGETSGSGFGLTAFIAVACSVGGAESISHKYLMP
ncbi:MAG: hypothetical protein HKO57_08405 [Akkermansiaceae bacterium]|nr:hypothetical protein [Akkermansiaceae bacterium]